MKASPKLHANLIDNLKIEVHTIKSHIERAEPPQPIQYFTPPVFYDTVYNIAQQRLQKVQIWPHYVNLLTFTLGDWLVCLKHAGAPASVLLSLSRMALNGKGRMCVVVSLLAKRNALHPI